MRPGHERLRPLVSVALGVILVSLLAYQNPVGPPAVPAQPHNPISMSPADGLPPKAPNPWFFLERAYPFDRIPHDVWEQALIQARILKEQAGPRSATWTFRGPTNIGGRITDLAVDPTDAGVAYAGAAEGGVLRTTDSGQHWTPLFDDQSTLSIGAVALDPTVPAVLYAGTGEVNPGGGSVAYGGSGIYRSTDRGNTWTPLGLESSGSIGRIRIDPTDPQRIYAAAMGNLWEKGPDRGVYRTTDGGATWQRVLFLSDSTGAVDLILRPDQPRTLFAAMWERIRHPGRYQYGGITCGVYKTTDGGDTWSLVGGGLPAPSTNLGRIGLSLCAAQPDVMHAVYADKTGYFAEGYTVPLTVEGLGPARATERYRTFSPPTAGGSVMFVRIPLTQTGSSSSDWTSTAARTAAAPGPVSAAACMWIITRSSSARVPVP